jgi:uncharacterized protein YegL
MSQLRNPFNSSQNQITKFEALAGINNSIPLQGIKYNVNVFGFLVIMRIGYEFKNIDTDKRTAEITFEYPIPTSSEYKPCVIFGLSADFSNGEHVNCKIGSKEDNIIKYDDAMASGKTAIFSSIDKNNSGDVFCNIGNLPYNNTVTVSLDIIFQGISIGMDKVRVSFPTSLFPSIKRRNCGTTIIFNAHRAVGIELHNRNYLINSQVSHYEIVKNSETNSIRSIYKSPYDSSKDICFDVLYDKKPMYMGSQIPIYSDEKHALIPMTMKTSYFKLKDNLNTEILFLVDCSGSMNGDGIKGLKNALHTIIQSLPPSILFNIVSFESSFSFELPLIESFSKDPFPKRNSLVQLNEMTWKDTKNVIEKLLAKGSTNMYSALDAVYNVPIQINNTRQIVIITDGQADDREKVIQLTRQKQSENPDVRIFAIGIGNDFDEDFIECLTTLGSGQYFIVEDQSKLDETLASLLNVMLVYSSTNIKIINSSEKINDNNDDIKIMDIDQIGSVYYDSLIPLNLSLKELENTSIQYITHDGIKRNEKLDINEIKRETIKYDQNLLFNFNVDNSIALKNPIQTLYAKKLIDKNKTDQEYTKNLALQFGILTKDTSFFGETNNGVPITQSIRQYKSDKSQVSFGFGFGAGAGMPLQSNPSIFSKASNFVFKTMENIGVVKKQNSQRSNNKDRLRDQCESVDVNSKMKTKSNSLEYFRSLDTEVDKSLQTLERSRRSTNPVENNNDFRDEPIFNQLIPLTDKERVLEIIKLQEFSGAWIPSIKLLGLIEMNINNNNIITLIGNDQIKMTGLVISYLQSNQVKYESLWFLVVKKANSYLQKQQQ